MTTQLSVTKRQKVERAIASRTIVGLLNAGYTLSVDNGESHTQPMSTKTDILKAMFQTDEERLMVHVAGIPPTIIGWVYFVYGNDGWDVINDYTTNLEKVMEPINRYADSYVD